ncbi:hypothetical protein [Parasphingorhabdus sp.]|jgi:hypothetical protein|uniref:hypothetical protein n=1 Tax=Parasphingorhabdus sp. TaxID=2709688 RepID=UPI0030AB6F4F
MPTKLKILLILAALLLGSAQTIVRLQSLMIPELQIFGLASYTVLLDICLLGIFSAAFIPVAIVR